MQGVVPKNQMTAINDPLYIRKEKMDECSCYRGISLLSVTGMV